MDFATFKQLYILEIGRTTQYRALMMLSIITGPFYFVIQYFIWQAVYQSQSVTAGLTFEQMISYFAIGIIFMYFLYDEADKEIAARVHKGDLNKVLLRPLSMIGELFVSKLAARSMAVLLEVIPVSILFMVFISPATLAPTGSWLLGVLGLGIAFTVTFQLNYIIGLSSFWLTRIHGFRLLKFNVGFLLSGMLFPLTITPEWIQKVLFYLPFHHYSYAPTTYWLGTFDLAGKSVQQSLLLAALWIIFMGIVILVMQHFAYKKYQGVGQ